MRVLHVWFCSYQLLTRSRLVYSGGTKTNLQMDWVGSGGRAICLPCEKKIWRCGRGQSLGSFAVYGRHAEVHLGIRHYRVDCNS
jgi:hypothetical protein